MVQKAGLINDIDFIKNFEELKLKQRLLIETLKNKGENKESILLHEVNSKLDFLVKLFKEAQGVDDEESHFLQVNEKIDALSNKFEQSLLQIMNKLDEISANKGIKKSIQETSQTTNRNSDSTSPNNLFNKKSISQKIESLDNKINENQNNIVKLDDGLELPLPDFKCEVEGDK